MFLLRHEQPLEFFRRQYLQTLVLLSHSHSRCVDASDITTLVKEIGRNRHGIHLPTIEFDTIVTDQSNPLMQFFI
jgi:hypothetical protein